MSPTLRTVKMSAKGQVVIPREFREALHLKQGDSLVVLQRPRELVLRPADEVAARIEEMSDREWQEMGLRGLADVWDNPEDAAWAAELEKLPDLREAGAQ